MRLGTKHQNQFQIVHADFSGGLNTSTSVDGIAENQLSRATNVEVDHATGKLRTVAGTVDVLKLENIFAAMYDDINRKLLVVKEDKKIYAFDLETHKLGKALGTLSGEIYPIATSWEDGILIASGGKLQYFNGKKFLTINTSPTAKAVYVRAGRILVSDSSSVHYSSVGDEETWYTNSNDDSSGIFVEAGYKDGGQLLAMVNLSSDVLMIKNNRRVYRLSGEYPDWSMSEISRNVAASGRLSVCAVSDSVFVLGREELQSIRTTNDYGDMKPQNVSTLIEREIKTLPENAILRFVPSLNQVWAISNSVVLIYDLVTQSWFKRQFNSQVLDVLSAEEEIFIVKPDRISKLDEKTFYDSGEALTWNFQCKRRISHYDYLLKNTLVSFMPLDEKLTDGEISAGKVVVKLSLGEHGSNTRRRLIHPTVLAQNRNVYRSKFLDIIGSGLAGGIIFDSIILDVVEV